MSYASSSGRADGDAARVRVLDDDAGRQRELARERAGGREVVEVVEGELLPVQLLDAREEMAADAALGVVGGALVRVLAVREVEHLVERDDERVGELLARVEPVRDRRFVCGRVREGLRREATPSLEGELAARSQLLEHSVVLLGPADRRAVGEVLGGAAQHRRAADVDRLDGLLLRDSVPRGDLLERIEVDADEVERLDPVLLERGDVLRLVAPGEDARRGRADGASSRARRASPARP